MAFFEFFSGGGMARLAIGGKMRCVFANDICKRKAASYRANFGSGELVLADVADLTTKDLPAEPAALAWASPPCVDISLAGRRAGLNARRSGAFWGFHDLMRDLAEAGRAPSVICIENVEPLLSSNGGDDFTVIVQALADLDYMVGAMVIDAAQFVPQSRRRLFIVAARAGDVTIGADLLQTGPAAPFHTKGLVEAYGRLPAALRRQWRWWRLPEPPMRSIELGDVLEPVRGDPAALARVLRLMSPAHRQKVESAAQARAPGETIVGAVNFRRRDGMQRAEVRFDGLANALRTAGGGSSIQTLLVLDDRGMFARKLTPRESARLMGLPERYRLPAGVTAAHDLVGDGVAVPVVAHLFDHLIEPLIKADVTTRRQLDMVTNCEDAT
ncbi:DNA cytosine methyltransferase [Methylocystis sp. H4A]|uniref:DNA cytosine methyltransferase n=1 Tax=Methylocystis sp. H4A TaxID=2785788 RepID=UPI0018C2F1E0|nr:DNA cytosine methyltransferase [Methylocystis sp. H4A]MBG0800777.1 DNA cytosine methyltransferase [Methylocystis sp. H4A]